jgi:hypothetical protein
MTWEKRHDYSPGMKIFKQHLLKTYRADHVVVIYEAAHLPTGQALCEPIELGELDSAHTTRISTLYVPLRDAGAPDLEMMERLGIKPSDVVKVERRLTPNLTTATERL